MNFEDLVTLYTSENNLDYPAALYSYCLTEDEPFEDIHLEVLEAAKELDYAF